LSLFNIIALTFPIPGGWIARMGNLRNFYPH